MSRVGTLTLSDDGFREYDSLKRLDLSQTGVATLKPSWFSRKTIEIINLSDNKIKALKKDDMKFFLNLKVFNASFNEIKTVEANTFLDLKRLEVLSLSHNQLVNAGFVSLENLKQLHLRGNAMVTVSAIIQIDKPNSSKISSP